jgi:hypothetical protein
MKKVPRGEKTDSTEEVSSNPMKNTVEKLKGRHSPRTHSKKRYESHKSACRTHEQVPKSFQGAENSKISTNMGNSR